MSNLNFRSIMVFSEKPEKLKEFYKKVFEREPDMNDDEYFGFMVGTGFVGFGAHDKVKGMSKNPERVMFNLETEDVKGEFVRIEKLGAKVIASPYEMQGMWLATFADPDGNYFQLMSPWEQTK